MEVYLRLMVTVITLITLIALVSHDIHSYDSPDNPNNPDKSFMDIAHVIFTHMIILITLGGD